MCADVCCCPDKQSSIKPGLGLWTVEGVGMGGQKYASKQSTRLSVGKRSR